MAGSNPNPTTGNVASGAADDASPPVKVGGVNGTITPAAGQRGDLQVDGNASLRVRMYGVNGSALYTLSLNNADGLSGAGQLAQFVASQGWVWNGTTLDKQYNNWNTTTGDTGAKTATFAGATQTNYNARGAFIYVLCGTISGTTPTMTAQLQWSPDAGTTWATIGPASATINTTGNSIGVLVYPTNWSQAAGSAPAVLTNGATTSLQLNAPLPRTWRLNYTITGTTPSFAITAVYVNYIL